ncbi:hypothetical protein EJ04DRAFT_507893 [Polyplosphaeria fusca]|uniref:Pre-mRNA-splicing factor n=1 Tax=Polyplosphaeria fusca TaxID=682080 RepID=A0A9P4V704_9PLEO|nr:hypothetical protein EJ04DRAFT_507893 [Polyplosphaeria fusca]
MSAPKVGFKLSLAAKNKNASNKPLRAPQAKRPRLDLDDEEPEDFGKAVEITGFDTTQGGAVDLDGKKEKAPLVIPALPNRSWIGGARRKRDADQQSNGKTNDMEEHKASAVAFGLNIMKKEAGNAMEVDEKAEDEKPQDDGLTEEQRLERDAVKALLTGDNNGNKLVIPAKTEEEVFRENYDNAPDAPTLESYEAVPIEGFGAALLRGMGWKDGEEIGGGKIKQTEVKPRPPLLGVGAKASDAVGIELGEWGSKGKGKQKIATFTPVALRNRITGETITEEELKQRLQEQERADEEEKKERQRNKYVSSDDERQDKSRRRERREHSDRKHKSKYDDNYDYDSGSKRDRKRRDDDDYDSGSKRDRRRRDDDYYESSRRREHREDKYDDYKKDSSRDHRKDDRRERSRDSHKRHRSRSRDDYHRKDRRDKDRRARDRSRSPATDDSRKRKRDRDRDDDDQYYDKRKRRDRDKYDDRHDDRKMSNKGKLVFYRSATE